MVTKVETSDEMNIWLNPKYSLQCIIRHGSTRSITDVWYRIERLSKCVQDIASHITPGSWCSKLCQDDPALICIVMRSRSSSENCTDIHAISVKTIINLSNKNKPPVTEALFFFCKQR